jgi:hypothetical protein
MTPVATGRAVEQGLLAQTSKAAKAKRDKSVDNFSQAPSREIVKDEFKSQVDTTNFGHVRFSFARNGRKIIMSVLTP